MSAVEVPTRGPWQKPCFRTRRAAVRSRPCSTPAPQSTQRCDAAAGPRIDAARRQRESARLEEDPGLGNTEFASDRRIRPRASKLAQLGDPVGGPEWWTVAPIVGAALRPTARHPSSSSPMPACRNSGSASRSAGSSRRRSVVWLALAADRLGRQVIRRKAPQAPPALRGLPFSPPARPAAGPAPRARPRRRGLGPAGHPRQFGRAGRQFPHP